MRSVVRIVSDYFAFQRDLRKVQSLDARLLADVGLDGCNLRATLHRGVLVRNDAEDGYRGR